MLVDLRPAGGLEDADWWLAIYVMLTRGRKLKNLILPGFTEQVEDLLRRGPYRRELASWKPKLLRRWSDCSPPVYDALQASWHVALPAGPITGFD